MNSTSIELDDVTLDVEVSGPDDGPLAICLHGFPDTRATYRHLAPHLADAGYRVVVPALRGYAPSSVSTRGDYRVAALASDAIALHERLGGDERAVLIGHDWGSTATELAAKAAPERFTKTVTIAVPPIGLFSSLFVRYDQLQRSWYMFFFQSPLADFVVSLDDFNFISRLWQDWSPDYEASDDVAYVRSALADPANLAAAIGYYRAAFGTPYEGPELADIVAATAKTATVPTLYLHGANDGCVPVAHVTDASEYLPVGSEFQIVDGAGHFLQLERPALVNELITTWLEG
jgi:pimeloyl-ACP methyl ester carboxylesterase